MMEDKGISVIITGSTGMVGEGVLHECLTDPRIAAITLLNRRSAGVNHPKVTEVLVPDLFSISGDEPGLAGADACFYCLGVTSVGKTEKEYTVITHDLTLTIAEKLKKLNPDMTFCYISAKGSDTSGRGKTMWASVKGRTETDLDQLGFAHFFTFRPFLLTPTQGLRYTHGFYKYISWFFPLGRLIYPDGFCTLKELALAMIYVGYRSYIKKIITPRDMVKFARFKRRR